MKHLLPQLAGLLIATALPAQTSDISLWVTLGDSDQLVEVDPFNYRELRRIKVDPRPHGLAISADGSKVYIASAAPDAGRQATSHSFRPGVKRLALPRL